MGDYKHWTRDLRTQCLENCLHCISANATIDGYNIYGLTYSYVLYHR